MSLETVLAALHVNPGDHLGWLAIADCLEEQGEVQRAELARLTTELAVPSQSPLQEGRIRDLLAAGVLPCMPTVTNSVGMPFALIPPGSFLMGSPAEESQRVADEARHEVELTRAFYLGIYPVTQAQYEIVIGTNPSYFNAERVKEETGDFPVELIGWPEAAAFCAKLNKVPAEKRAKRRYRLPTEAEWEYACRARAGAWTVFHYGNTLTSHQANFVGNNPYGKGAAKGPNLKRTTSVGSYRPNAFGLFDMHGNVWEWCSDWYDQHYYAVSPRCDPPGPESGRYHIFRGGSYLNFSGFLRTAFRGHSPTERYSSTGFRVVLEWDR